jgi:hypothetical protein
LIWIQALGGDGVSASIVLRQDLLGKLEEILQGLVFLIDSLVPATTQTAKNTIRTVSHAHRGPSALLTTACRNAVKPNFKISLGFKISSYSTAVHTLLHNSGIRLLSDLVLKPPETWQ